MGWCPGGLFQKLSQPFDLLFSLARQIICLPPRDPLRLIARRLTMADEQYLHNSGELGPQHRSLGSPSA